MKMPNAIEITGALESASERPEGAMLNELLGVIGTKTPRISGWDYNH